MLSKIKPYLICSGIWLLVIAGVIYYFQSNINVSITEPLVTVIKATRELNVGDIITEKDIKVDRTFASHKVPNAAVDFSIIGAKVTAKIMPNEQIVLDRLVLKDEIVDEDLREYAIPVTISTTVANRIKIYDEVEVWVSYTDGLKKADLIIPRIVVKDLRNNSGKSISVDTSSVPSYAVFDLDIDTITILDDAQKKGTIFLVKIPKGSRKNHQKTYIPSWVSK